MIRSAAAMMALLVCGVTTAAELHVPSQYGTIQVAVDAASDGDVIVVEPGIYTGTGTSHVVNTLGKSLFLLGSGQADTVISGEGVRRGIFSGGGSESTTTTIQGFMITDGHASTGAGIWLAGAGTTTIVDCTIQGNVADIHGGGIMCSYGIPGVNVINCLIVDNEAPDGGGVNLYGNMPSGHSIELEECTIANNRATKEWDGYSGAQGGGIRSRRFGLSMTNCLVVNNTATSFGGGAYILPDDNATLLSGVIFSGNSTLGFPGKGGGVYKIGGSGYSHTLLSCVIASNQSTQDGGGVYVSSGGAHFANSVVCGNSPNQIWGEWSDGGLNTIDAICDNNMLGACCVANECDLTYQIECSGSWLGAGTYCDGQPCDQVSPIGACCWGNGDGCSMTTSDKCSGEWLGEGINCDEIICEPFGACCINDTCTVTIEAWCSGTWLGDFTDCTGGPCGAPDPMGACCTGVACSDLTGIECQSIGGTWFGEQIACSDSPCDGVTHVVPTDYPTIQSAVNAAQHGDTILVMPGIYTSTVGEVVKLNGKAISLVSQSTYGAIIDGDGTRRGIVCTAGEGPTTSISGFMVRDCWTGGGGGGFLIGESSSPTIENCLIRNNVAVSAGGGILSSDASNPTISGTTICGNSPDQIAGNWDDGGSNEITEECPPDVIGGCCIDFTCTLSTELDCSGEWLGEGTDCSGSPCGEPEPIGACCITYTCSISTELDCDGEWLGDGTNCLDSPCEPGACCIDFTCTLSTELDCSGEWLGEGTDCSGSPCGEPEPIGACCIRYTCSISTELDCDGEWLGDGTNCLDSPCEPGACCIDFQCTVTTETDCDGTWLGEFINCTGGPCGAPDPMGACCTGVACSDLTGIECQSIGGTWFGEQIACSDSPCDGVTHVVPTDYPTIQSAVNAAQHGDTILVMPGIYTSTVGEVVKLNGKAISLVSQSTYGAIIDGDGTRRGIVCTAGEGPTTSISGFMVRDCWTGGGGGGFLIGESSSPTIENCLIRNNVAVSAGGGILSSGASNPTISGTTICGNSPDQIAGNWDDGGSNEITEECPPDVIGGCCIDFTCTLSTELDCSGEWLGEGTDCSGTPCGNPDGMGVCCINEICTETTQQECEGTWFGEGTSCRWGTCTFPSGYGACCLDSICTEVDEFSCIFAGGGWLGDGSTCDDYGCVGSESIAIRWQVVGPDRLSGATANYTVDVFVELPSQWRLDAVAGNSTQQKMVASTTSFYQDIYGGPTSQEVNPAFYPLAPDLRWDSRVTIGCLDSSGMPFNENTLNTIGIDWSTFENGGDLSVGNGTWFVLPIDEQGMSQPFVDSDCTTRNGVRIARLTTMEHSAEILFEALFQGRDASNATWQGVVAGTIQYAGEQDCNDNGSPDECDILSGQSADTNLDGIPDECACLADLNGDGIVDVTDILSLIEHFGTTGPQGDVDGDGFVGIDDLLILISAWGPCP